MMSDFFRRIKEMNEVMKIGNPSKLKDLGLKRIIQFRTIINDEVKEVDDVIEKSQIGPHDSSVTASESLVDYFDWLSDMIVYSASEMVRWGVDPDHILQLVMDSQESKLDENGEPIHCPETGKFLKGPNYQAPEPMIRAYLFGDDDGEEG